MTDTAYTPEQLAALRILEIAGVCPGWFITDDIEWAQLVNDGYAVKGSFTNEYFSTAPEPNERREKQLKAIERAAWYLIPMSEMKRIIRLAQANDWRKHLDNNRAIEPKIREVSNRLFIAFRPEGATMSGTYIPTSIRDYRGRIRTA